jgi:hypothetical protein
MQKYLKRVTYGNLFCMEDHRLSLRRRTGESDEYQEYQSVSVGLEYVRKD